MKKLLTYLFLIVCLCGLLIGCTANVVPVTPAEPKQQAGISEESTGNQPADQATAAESDAPPQPEKPADIEGAAEQTPTAEQADDAEYTCTVAISCATILYNWEMLDQDKADLVPTDGMILATTSVAFTPGESVFDVLKRAVKQAGIQMESVNTPLLDSVYIEGINNIYEFDCGSLSGWTYQVNGISPEIGCSCYILTDGDSIEFIYTCDLGRDV